ncbi:transcription repressor OFP15-like [Primulina huaijiensis]|uniref:transcription repressor OFP15-like n=1 Tax=Primulina huaijiensis TaxID=1492673 RepID=UPI003CC79C37
MSCILWKSFNLCFSKFNCLPTIKFTPPFTDQKSDENLHNHEKSLSLTSTSTHASAVEDYFFSSSSPEDSDTADYIPNFASVFASQRFFFSNPGSSNSIFEPTKVEVPGPFLSDGMAIRTYSQNPYADFHKSMQEMIEAHELMDVESSWEFLHELLCCYLTLNPKHAHKFIVAAFADVILSLSTPRKLAGNHVPARQHCTVPPAVARSNALFLKEVHEFRDDRCI